MNNKRKKILIVRATMGKGGADRVTQILLQNLDANLYDISLLLMRKEGPHLANLPAHIRVVDAKCSSLWFFLPAILATIKRFKPDIVFSTCGGSNIPLSFAAFFSPLRKWKAILSERNILFPPGKNAFKRSMMLLSKAVFYRFVDGLTAVSEGVRADMSKKLLISPGRVRVVDNPIIDDNLRIKAAERVDHPWFVNSSVPVIVHAGRFVYQKDHETLVRAFDQARKLTPSRLFLLGDGPLVPKIKNLVNSLGLDNDVEFAGFDPNPFRYMARCNVFVLSSLHEGMPGVLIQAMACGAPSISTDCPYGPAEIISSPGENGVLVDVRNVNQLAHSIVRVLSDKEFANKLRAKAPGAVKRFEVGEAIKTYVLAIES